MHPQSKSRLPVMLLLAVPVAGCLGPFKDVGDLDDSGGSSAGESDTATSTSTSGGETSGGATDTDSPGDSEDGSTGDDPTGDDSTGDPSGGEPVCDNEFVPLADILQTILFDIQSRDAADRPFIRYFTLTHLYNAGVCPDQRDVYREGVGKLINSLSSDAQINDVVAIEELGIVLGIDIRDYGWDQPLGIFADKWEALVASSPYAVEYLLDEAETTKLFAETAVPMLPADAFIEFASQPGAGAGAAIGNGTDIGYHEFANTPDDIVDLQIFLGINIEDNIEDREVARAGFTNSGASPQNRIVERHEGGVAGSTWLAYGFADDSIVDQNIFASPLDFEPSALDVIFPLQNGLHGYMQVLANGSRVDVGPADIVVDPNQADGQVVTGVSCFGCHPILFTNGPDEIRPYVLGPGFTEFNAQERNAIEQMYVANEDFQDLLAEDNARFHLAIAAAGGDPTAPLEPITNVLDRFAGDVDVVLAAAELGISPPALLTQIGTLDPALSPLSLIGGTVTRETWGALYPQTVCLVGIGVAHDGGCD